MVSRLFWGKQHLCLVVSKSCGAFGVVISCFFLWATMQICVKCHDNIIPFQGFQSHMFIKGTLRCFFFKQKHGMHGSATSSLFPVSASELSLKSFGKFLDFAQGSPCLWISWLRQQVSCDGGRSLGSACSSNQSNQERCWITWEVPTLELDPHGVHRYWLEIPLFFF